MVSYPYREDDERYPLLVEASLDREDGVVVEDPCDEGVFRKDDLASEEGRLRKAFDYPRSERDNRASHEQDAVLCHEAIT